MFYLLVIHHETSGDSVCLLLTVHPLQVVDQVQQRVLLGLGVVLGVVLLGLMVVLLHTYGSPRLECLNHQW